MSFSLRRRSTSAASLPPTHLRKVSDWRAISCDAELHATSASTCATNSRCAQAGLSRRIAFKVGHSRSQRSRRSSTASTACAACASRRWYGARRKSSGSTKWNSITSRSTSSARLLCSSASRRCSSALRPNAHARTPFQSSSRYASVTAFELIALPRTSRVFSPATTSPVSTASSITCHSMRSSADSPDCISSSCSTAPMRGPESIVYSLRGAR